MIEGLLAEIATRVESSGAQSRYDRLLLTSLSRLMREVQQQKSLSYIASDHEIYLRDCRGRVLTRWTLPREVALLSRAMDGHACRKRPVYPGAHR